MHIACVVGRDARKGGRRKMAETQATGAGMLVSHLHRVIGFKVNFARCSFIYVRHCVSPGRRWRRCVALHVLHGFERVSQEQNYHFGQRWNLLDSLRRLRVALH